MARAIAIAPDVAEVLSRSTVIGGNTVALPDGQLDRDLYVAVDKVLKALGGKWSRGKGHVFALGLGDQLEQALTSGQAVDLKKANEQFFTPWEVIRRMLDRLGVQPGDAAMEPSAGSGRIVAAMLERGAEVVAIEIDERYLSVLRDLQRDNRRLVIEHGDFLAMARPAIRPDVIAMNPPFSKGQDVQHFQRAWEILAPGGRIACIVGEHGFTASDARSVAFRNLLHDIGVELETLPPGTFKDEGTMVGAQIIYASKLA